MADPWNKFTLVVVLLLGISSNLAEGSLVPQNLQQQQQQFGERITVVVDPLANTEEIDFIVDPMEEEKILVLPAPYFANEENAHSLSSTSQDSLPALHRGRQGRARPVPPPRPLPPRRRRPGLIGALGSIGDRLKCGAEDAALSARLGDRRFMRRQIDCVLGRAPCDEDGAEILRLAPDILRGVCPAPCNRCRRRHIRKAMAVMAQEYPREWSQIIKEQGVKLG